MEIDIRENGLGNEQYYTSDKGGNKARSALIVQTTHLQSQKHVETICTICGLRFLVILLLGYIGSRSPSSWMQAPPKLENPPSYVGIFSRSCSRQSCDVRDRGQAVLSTRRQH